MLTETETRAAVSVPEATAQTLVSHPYRFLGSYRLLLALLVLTSHASGYLGPFIGGLQLGNVGVMLFFVVSGAVIAEALDIFYRTSSRRFLVNRFLKIFPAYWAALAVYYAVFLMSDPEAVRGELWPIVVNVSLLLSYLPSGNNLLLIDIAWAVMVELQFYLIIATVYFFARRTPAPGVIIYAAGAAALAFYIYVDAAEGFTRFYGMFRFAPYFVLGAALYYVYLRRDPRVTLLAAVAAGLSFHAYFLYVVRAVVLQFPWGGAFGIPGDHIATTVLFGVGLAMFCWLLTATFPRRAEQLDKRLGDITYAIYLIHPAVILVAINLQLESRFGGPPAYMFVLVVSSLIAMVIFRVVERPVMKLRNLFRGRRLYD